MLWIEGLARTPNGFVLEVLHKDGTRTQEPLVGLNAKLFKGETSRTRISTDCRTWSVISAQPFWEKLGIDGYQPRDGHEVFRVLHENMEYLIPASVVMAAFIRPIKHIHSYLFRPHGLEQMSIPLLDAPRPSVGFFSPVSQVTGSSRMVTDGLLASYSWMHCFPSGREMWDSVYQAAQEGRASIVLPKASISTVFHSVSWNGAHLVTDMVITALHAEEAPYDYALGHTREITFHESASLDWGCAHQHKKGPPSRDGVWSLSDDEWNQLRPAIQRKSAMKHDLRHILDLILLKLGTGLAWRKLDFQGLNFSIVQASFRRMQGDGRWDVLEKALASMRCSSESQRREKSSLEQ